MWPPPNKPVESGFNAGSRSLGDSGSDVGQAESSAHSSSVCIKGSKSCQALPRVQIPRWAPATVMDALVTTGVFMSAGPVKKRLKLANETSFCRLPRHDSYDKTKLLLLEAIHYLSREKLEAIDPLVHGAEPEEQMMVREELKKFWDQVENEHSSASIARQFPELFHDLQGNKCTDGPDPVSDNARSFVRKCMGTQKFNKHTHWNQRQGIVDPINWTVS